MPKEPKWVMRFSRVVLSIGILSALIGSSCRVQEKLVIAVVPQVAGQIFWQLVHAGADAAGREFGARILWKGPTSEGDAANQIHIMADFIDQHVDAIVLAPAHGESLVASVERAAQERIPVAIIESGIRTEKYLSLISSDNYKAGVFAGERMGNSLPDGGKIAMIGNVPGRVSTSERESAFRETLARKYPLLQVVDFQFGMSDPSISRSIAAKMLAAQPDLAGIFSSNEAGTAGAVEASKFRGVGGRIKIVGFDGSPRLVEDLKTGSLDALVVQQPYRMGYLAVKAVADHFKGISPERRIETPIRLATRLNIEDSAVRELLPR